MKRFTLSYLTQSRRPVTLYNVSENVVVLVIRAQRALGSTNFKRIEQPRNYSQQEIDLLRERKLQRIA